MDQKLLVCIEVGFKVMFIPVPQIEVGKALCVWLLMARNLCINST